METMKLKKPVMIDGEEKKEIVFDLDNLTGQQLEAADRDVGRAGIQVGAIELNPCYHMAVFAQAAGISYEDVKRMGARDCREAIAKVRSFFVSDLEEPSEPDTSDK